MLSPRKEPSSFSLTVVLAAPLTYFTSATSNIYSLICLNWNWTAFILHLPTVRLCIVLRNECSFLQGVLKAVEKRAHDVKRMNEAGDELANKLDKYNGMSSEARREQQTTNERYERIRLELQNREHLIEAQVKASDQFMTALQEFELDLTGVDAAILEEPAGNDSDALKRQLAELQVCSKHYCTRLSVKLI